MKLKELVYNFREAIERAKDNGEPGEFFRKFPIGQCGNSSDILAQYLIDNGFYNVVYVCGTYYGETVDDFQSHAWLIVGRLIVDITADQFKDEVSSIRCDIPVYVASESEYYRQFEVKPGDRHRHKGLQNNWMNYSELKSWYAAILKYM